MTERQLEKQKQMIAAAKEFIAGAKPKEVMEKYGVCYASIWNAIKKYNLPYEKTWGRTVFFNEQFFENIDTEQKAYWLGFIFADGSVIKTDKRIENYNRIYIGLAIKDKSHLKKLESILEFSESNRIKIHHKKTNGNDFCYLHMNSTKMCSDIISHGCVPNKTYNINHIPIGIPENLIRHFIRGYFDGDGCISGKPTCPIFSITTCKTHNEWMQAYLMKYCKLSRTKLKPYRNIHELRYGGINQAIRIFHYLYDNATVFLERKYNKFLTYVSCRDQTISSSSNEELSTSV